MKMDQSVPKRLHIKSIRQSVVVWKECGGLLCPSVSNNKEPGELGKYAG
jgi:hypothetical protein